MTEPATNTVTELDMLGQHWREAKASEDAARAERIKIEGQIIDVVGVKEEGTTSRKTDWFRIKTNGRLTRSLDEQAFMAVRDKIEDPPVNYKVALDLKRLRDLEKTDPDAYRLMLSCIETKPAKAAVRVELLRN